MSAFVGGLLTGVLSGCGIGGGSRLQLWLALVQEMTQVAAGGVGQQGVLAGAAAALEGMVAVQIGAASAGGAAVARTGEAVTVDAIGGRVFKGEIPEITNMVPFEPFDFYIKRKLYVHNMGHATCAYLGGYERRK